ncbi:MAG: hypothetical protein IPM35_14190 [Myxococcales bacterium]|nr:hypothetical protein [Myxococcales bacterium]
MRRRLFLGVLLAAIPLRAEERVIEAGREREVLALLSPHELAHEVVPGWKLWNVKIGARAIELELAGPGGAEARLTLTERGDAGESSASFGIARDVAAQTTGRAAADVLVAALGKNDSGSFWRPRPHAAPVEPPNPARGIAWPLGVAGLSIAAMWWLSRRA